MKKLRNLLMLTLCMAMVGTFATSCLSDDNNNNNNSKVLSPAEKTAMMANMAGAYNGFIYFVNDSARLDSVAVTCSISAPDSMFTIHNFPYKVLGVGLNNETMRKTVEAAGEGVLREVFQLYYNNADAADQFYTFWALPLSENELTKKFTYEDKEHEIKVKYSGQLTNANSYGIVSVYYPVGEYYNKELLVYLLIEKVTIDSDERLVNRVMYIYGKK